MECAFTLFSFQKVLAAHGAAKISAYVTHGIFPNRSWQRFKHDNGGIFALLLAYIDTLLFYYMRVEHIIPN